MDSSKTILYFQLVISFCSSICALSITNFLGALDNAGLNISVRVRGIIALLFGILALLFAVGKYKQSTKSFQQKKQIYATPAPTFDILPNFAAEPSDSKDTQAMKAIHDMLEKNSEITHKSMEQVKTHEAETEQADISHTKKILSLKTLYIGLIDNIFDIIIGLIYIIDGSYNNLVSFDNIVLIAIGTMTGLGNELIELLIELNFMCIDCCCSAKMLDKNDNNWLKCIVYSEYILSYFEVIVAFITVFTFDINVAFIVIIVIILVGLICIVSLSLYQFNQRTSDLDKEKEELKSQPTTPKSTD